MDTTSTTVKLRRTERHRLQKLIYKGKLSKLKRYINKQKIDVKGARMKHGDTLLHCACRKIRKKSRDIFTYLLNEGLATDIYNNQHNTPLHIACGAACKDSSTDLILMLIKAQPSVLDMRDSNGNTPRKMMNAFKNQLREEHDKVSMRVINLPKNRNVDEGKHRTSIKPTKYSNSSFKIDSETDLSSNNAEEDSSESEVVPTMTDRLGASQNFSGSDLYNISDANDSDTSDTSWNKRLAAEMEFEMNDADGDPLWSSYNDSEANSYADWADGISAEYRQNQQKKYQQNWQNAKSNNPKSTTKSSTAGYNIPRISEEKKKEFKRKMAEAQKEYLAALEAKKVNKLIELKASYEAQCDRILCRYSEGESTSVIGFEDIPWPHKQNGGVEDVGAFLFADMKKDSSEYLEYLRKQRVRWHPDRFLQRCGRRLKKSDYDKVLCKVTEISKLLNNLYLQNSSY